MLVEWNGQQVMDEVHNRIRNGMLASAEQVVSIARSLAPKKTGRLAMGLGYDFNDAELTVVFTAEAPWSIFQEYGTRYIPPHPYLRPAINHVFSQTFGINTEMAFLNTPHINQPILAHGAGFHLPPTLTAKQLAHVREHLLPTSKRYYVGAVSRTRMHVRKHY
jgi:HK97 gp10 family phage protein